MAYVGGEAERIIGGGRCVVGGLRFEGKACVEGELRCQS